MSTYVCSLCGAGAYHDGRCGDGPILMCGCDKQKKWYVDPASGESKIATSPATAIPKDGGYADRH